MKKLKLDLFWKSKPEWTEFKNGNLFVRKDAPKEAQESFKRYMDKIKNSNCV